MGLEFYQVDAFTNRKFGGNPAAVFLLSKWLPIEEMQNIAAEMNLSETAFMVKTEEGYHLRWFTPLTEVRLCGHATLAAAHVLFSEYKIEQQEIIFSTELAGTLKVKRANQGYEMEFPLDVFQNYNEEFPSNIISEKIVKVVRGTDDLMLILASEDEVLRCKSNNSEMIKLPFRAIIVTSKSSHCDFVSRVFAPACGIDEDPVTGSAHTLMASYWSEELNKKQLRARQVSKRGGMLTCNVEGSRVILGGEAITVIKGMML